MISALSKCAFQSVTSSARLFAGGAENHDKGQREQLEKVSHDRILIKAWNLHVPGLSCWILLPTVTQHTVKSTELRLPLRGGAHVPSGVTQEAGAFLLFHRRG